MKHSNVSVVIPRPNFDPDALEFFDEESYNRTVDSILSDGTRADEYQEESADDEEEEYEDDDSEPEWVPPQTHSAPVKSRYFPSSPSTPRRTAGTMRRITQMDIDQSDIEDGSSEDEDIAHAAQAGDDYAAENEDRLSDGGDDADHDGSDSPDVEAESHPEVGESGEISDMPVDDEGINDDDTQGQRETRNDRDLERDTARISPSRNDNEIQPDYQANRIVGSKPGTECLHAADDCENSAAKANRPQARDKDDAINHPADELNVIFASVPQELRRRVLEALSKHPFIQQGEYPVRRSKRKQFCRNLNRVLEAVGLDKAKSRRFQKYVKRSYLVKYGKGLVITDNVMKGSIYGDEIDDKLERSERKATKQERKRKRESDEGYPESTTRKKRRASGLIPQELALSPRIIQHEPPVEMPIVEKTIVEEHTTTVPEPSAAKTLSQTDSVVEEHHAVVVEQDDAVRLIAEKDVAESAAPENSTVEDKPMVDAAAAAEGASTAEGDSGVEVDPAIANESHVDEDVAVEENTDVANEPATRDPIVEIDIDGDDQAKGVERGKADVSQHEDTARSDESDALVSEFAVFPTPWEFNPRPKSRSNAEIPESPHSTSSEKMPQQGPTQANDVQPFDAISDLEEAPTGMEIATNNDARNGSPELMDETLLHPARGRAASPLQDLNGPEKSKWKPTVERQAPEENSVRVNLEAVSKRKHKKRNRSLEQMQLAKPLGEQSSEQMAPREDSVDRNLDERSSKHSKSGETRKKKKDKSDRKGLDQVSGHHTLERTSTKKHSKSEGRESQSQQNSIKDFLAEKKSVKEGEEQHTVCESQERRKQKEERRKERKAQKRRKRRQESRSDQQSAQHNGQEVQHEKKPHKSEPKKAAKEKARKGSVLHSEQDFRRPRIRKE